MPGGKTFTNIKDKKIMIYKVVTEKNFDEAELKYAPISDTKLWASYRSLSGDQLTLARALGYKADAMFIINWRPDVEPNMAVGFRGEMWTIHRVDDLEGYKGDIKLTCEMISHLQNETYPEAL